MYLLQTWHRSSSLLSPHPSKPLQSIAVDRQRSLVHRNILDGQVSPTMKFFIKNQNLKRKKRQKKTGKYILETVFSDISQSILRRHNYSNPKQLDR